MKIRSGLILLILFFMGCQQVQDAPSIQPVEVEEGAKTAVSSITQPNTNDSVEVVETAVPVTSTVSPQIGLNFIRFYWGEGGTVDKTTPYYQPDYIFTDFDALGVDAFRQFIFADLTWTMVEPKNDEWNFDQADAVIMNATSEPIVTLFSIQYASPTPPWPTQNPTFSKTMTPEATDYVTTVVQRYAPYVTYWEIGNEMDHWRAFDPYQDNALPPQRPPAVVPEDGFSPQEQGAFLAEVSALIRANDPDAVVVMPGMGGLDEYVLDTWFAGLIEGGGTNWFDVVNYHYYSSWKRLSLDRERLQSFLGVKGITGKPVWLSETGATADESLNGRTDYPNSPETQAADIFRRTIQAYALGDSFVGWHTYIGSPAIPENLWRLYGVRTDTAVAQPSYYAFQLLTTELLPYESVQAVGNEPNYVYIITTMDGEVRYTAWGRGELTVPEGVTQQTSVIPNADGRYTWQPAASGNIIQLTEMPILLR
jgi:hypothetical protein